MQENAMMQELAAPVEYPSNLTPRLERELSHLVNTIDIHNREKVMAYGREEQAAIGKFYDEVLQGKGMEAVGGAGDILMNVIAQINGYNESCQNEGKRLLSFFQKQKSKLYAMQTRYRSLSANIEAVVSELKSKDENLRRLDRKFDMMYQQNLAMYNFLTMVIYAGEQVLANERKKCERLKRAAEATGDMMRVQMANDYGDDVASFERRIYDLKVSRIISLQQAPQIRNIQKSARQISESIQSTITTAIPLWKSQMAIALGMQAVSEGIGAVNAVRGATNAMLIRNSEMNKQLAIDSARAVESGMVNLDTIATVNQNLIDALSGSTEIARSAVTAREEGAKALERHESELKKAVIRYTTRT